MFRQILLQLEHVGISGDLRIDLVSIRGGATWINQSENNLQYGFGIGIDAENSTVEYALQIQPTIDATYPKSYSRTETQIISY